MSPETAAFLAALFRWTLAGTNPLDYAETVRGARDSNVPAFAVVEDRPVASPALAAGTQSRPGLRVRALVPQQIEDSATEARALVEFDFNSWPLTFAYHNAQLRSRGGRQAVHEGWVAYSGQAVFVAGREGAYTFSVGFRSPATTSCYGHLALGGVEVFPDFERRVRRRVPPRIVLGAGERRVFQREVRLEPGRYDFSLIVACHPDRKPSIRLAAAAQAPWQASEVLLQVKAPGEAIARAISAGELVQP